MDGCRRSEDKHAWQFLWVRGWENEKAEHGGSSGKWSRLRWQIKQQSHVVLPSDKDPVTQHINNYHPRFRGNRRIKRMLGSTCFFSDGSPLFFLPFPGRMGGWVQEKWGQACLTLSLWGGWVGKWESRTWGSSGKNDQDGDDNSLQITCNSLHTNCYPFHVRLVLNLALAPSWVQMGHLLK